MIAACAAYSSAASAPASASAGSRRAARTTACSAIGEKYLSFDALEGEDRQERDDDDRLGEQDRVPELDRGVPSACACASRSRCAAGLCSAAPTASLTISASTSTTALSMMMPKSTAPSEIRLADTPRASIRMNANSSDSGMTRGDDQRRAPVAQEYQQDRDHQQRADRQVLGHGVHGVVDQFGAVVDTARCCTPGGSRAATFAISIFEVLDHLGRVLPLGHLHDALHDVVALVERDDARTADARRSRTSREVADLDRPAVARGDHHRARCRPDARNRPMPRITSASSPRAQQAAAGVGAVVGERLRDLVDGDAVLAQQERIDPDLVFLDASRRS